MYDLEILIPADINCEHIKKRFIDFKSWGLINIKSHKVKVVLATPPGDNTWLKDDWPENVDVEILKTPYHHVAQRNTYYYAHYIKPNTARWYMRIDEDSMNDIGGLLHNLDRMYDSDGLYHIVSECNNEYWHIDRNLLRSMGYGWWESTGRIAHEWEISITSRAAIEKICAHDKAIEYMRLRQEFDDGWGDHSLAYCARMVKIYPVVAGFLTKDAQILNFSAFGGHKNHIHEICHDRCYHLTNWLRSYFNNKKISGDQPAILSVDDDWKRVILLKENNLVFSEHEKIGLWHKSNDDKIRIYIRDKHDSPLVFNMGNKKEATCDCGFLKLISTIY